MVARVSDPSLPSSPGPSPSEPREGSLLAWQWRHYPTNHRHGTNLIIHLVTVPLFHLGLASLVLGVFVGVVFVVSGLVAMVLAIVLQGVGHKRESVPPIPFRGPSDALARIVVEQLVTFPRYIASGLFDRAWAAARRRPRA